MFDRLKKVGSAIVDDIKDASSELTEKASGKIEKLTTKKYRLDFKDVESTTDMTFEEVQRYLETNYDIYLREVK